MKIENRRIAEGVELADTSARDVSADAFTIGVARCCSYAAAEVEESFRLALARAGGFPAVDCTEVLIKANLLSPTAPDAAVTTHPAVLCAIAAGLRGGCGKDLAVHVADAPGYVFTDAGQLLQRTGVAALRESHNITSGVLSDRGVTELHDARFRTLSHVRVFNRYFEAPYCVNAAKLKTHVETEMTGCIKNLFGTADTETRKRGHRSTSQRRLAEAIVDIFTVKPPVFHVLDAVIGMEGDGPSHGRPREVGWIVAGRNALAVDWVGATIMGYENPLRIPLIAAAAARGLGPASSSEIELRGAEWNDLPCRGFRKSSGALRILPTFLRGVAHGLVSIRPRLNPAECVRCQICEKVCPVDAITMENGYPNIDKATCVRCLCCHEMCPTGAMEVRRNFLASLFGRSRGG